jgi:hypothetical protein
MNEKAFAYTSHHGTRFTSARCDFSTPIEVHEKPKTALYVKDVAEMIGYHATNVWPQLNGFQGYDCLDFIEKS